MKKVVFYVLISCTMVHAGFSQSAKFTEAMGKQLQKLEKDSTIDAYQQSANSFERIGQAEKTEWLPYYYAAYSLVMKSYNEPNVSNLDAILDKADEMIGMAESLEAKNSEITTLKAMVLQSRMRVDMSRGMTMGPKSAQLLQLALTQMPAQNPRAMMNMAQNIFYTPEAFGGSKQKGIAMMKKAVEWFNTFQPTTALHPNWGKEYTESTLKQFEAAAK